ncbi:MAG: hypothetical protein ACLGPL_09690, partial [Acidobacteriota bacterium]
MKIKSLRSMTLMVALATLIGLMAGWGVFTPACADDDAAADQAQCMRITRTDQFAPTGSPLSYSRYTYSTT